jgi:hypothetical protein
MAVPVVDSGARWFLPSLVGGTSTAEQVFPAIVYPNAGLNSVTASTPGPLSCAIKADGSFEMQRFTVKASGKLFVHGTSPTMLWKMYNGTSMTVASDGTALLTMSALTGLTTNKWYPWSWTSEFQGDSSSGILQAISSTLWVDNATAGTITLTGIASGMNLTANASQGVVASGYSSAGLNLIMSFQETVSDALNKCYCAQFVVEM